MQNRPLEFHSGWAWMGGRWYLHQPAKGCIEDNEVCMLTHVIFLEMVLVSSVLVWLFIYQHFFSCYIYIFFLFLLSTFLYMWGNTTLILRNGHIFILATVYDLSWQLLFSDLHASWTDYRLLSCICSMF
jgi:hypothetical protein